MASADGSDNIDVVIAVNGANDAATITGDTTGSVTEDGTLTASGDLNVADVDTGQNVIAAQTNVAGTYGSFDINAAGNWTYTLTNTAAVVQALAAGTAPTETFNVASADGSDNIDVVIAVNGANDAATITGDTTGSVTEDGTLTASGDLNVADVDTGQNVIAAQTDVAGTYGSFDITADGIWTYTLTNTAAVVQALATGTAPTETFNVVSADSSANIDVVVTVNGANDAATITGDTTGSVTEDGTLTASGDLNVADVDTGQNIIVAQTDVAGTYGSFDITADGSWTYTLTNTAAVVQALATGTAPTETFNVASADSSANIDVVITVNGANDAATITGDTTGSVTEDGTLTANGDLDVADVDTGQDVVVAQTNAAGTYGSFDITADWQLDLHADQHGRCRPSPGSRHRAHRNLQRGFGRQQR